MAKVGHALGAKQWDALALTVVSALVAALATGGACALALWGLQRPLLRAIALQTQPERDAASALWPYAVARLPPLLLLRAASGVLVGYQRLRVASVLNAALAGVDALAFYA
eukprot:5032966-Prymnesium_polylepis.1